MSRMFREVTRTWNPVTGCNHGCSYCYARRLAEGRLRHLPRYADGFKPRLIPEELCGRFHKGLIFVSDMGDLWGEWVPKDWIEEVLDVVRRSGLPTFLFLTKNPVRYQEFNLLPNVIAGATIETNRHFTGSPALGSMFYSRAPYTIFRYLALRDLRHPRKFVSIEPIMDFELEGLVSWMRDIAPEFVYIGYANHGHHLPEPELARTQELIRRLGEFTEVRTKTLREAWWA